MMLKLGVVLLLAYTCAGQSAEPEKCSDYTLPGTFVPESYNLQLLLDDPKADTYEGKVTIKGKTKDAEGEYKTIVMNAKDITIIKKEHVTVTKGTTAITVSAVTPEECEKIKIELSEDLGKNADVDIVIKFTAKLRTDMYGLYKSTHKTDSGEETIIASQFQPTHARSAFPCFDEPAMKATFELQVDVPEEYNTVLSNQREKDQAKCQMPYTGRLKRFCFKPTPKMSTYLLALVVSKFNKVDAKDATNTMRLYAQPALSGKLEEAARVTDGILKTLSSITGIDYFTTIDKLDQVAIPDFSAGAMENWGLVTYRESALLYDAAYSTARNKQRTSQIIAHEFSHMWFGNLLTTETWDTTWLNEGFARYFEYFGIKALESTANEQFVVEQVQSALAADDVADASSLNEEAKSPEKIKAKFSTISYNKGASILRMLQHYLGVDKDKKSVFLTKLNSYLDTNINAGGTTTPDKLWKAFHVDKTGDIEGNMVNDIFPKWASQPGYPVVTVSLSDDNKLTFKQEPFTYTKELDDTKKALKWTIPITYWSYTTKFEEGQVIFDGSKDAAEANAKENTEFVVVNPDQTGYYRVKYDGALLDKLGEALQNKTIRDKINVIARAQIVDDAFNLARAGQTTYGQAMSIVSYLADEVSYYPWHAAFRGYSYLRRRVTDETLSNYIVRQMTELSEAVYNETLKSKTSLTDIEIYRKVLVHQWMCELNEEDCVNNAKELFDQQFADKDAKDVDVNERSFVYCSVLRHSDKENWKKLWDRYQAVDNANEKVTILTALGCTTDEGTLNEYLTMSVESDAIRSQDANTVFNAVLTGNPVGVSLAVAFLKEKHVEIKTKYGGLNALNNLVLSVADRIVSDADREALQAILDDSATEMGLTDEIVKAAKDTLTANKDWIDNNQESLSAYYKGLYGGGAASMTAAAGLLVLVVLNFFL